VIAAVERAVGLTWNQVRHRARLVRDFSDVPPVLADESRLVQVFVNLIANAADALEASSAGGRITIATRAEDSSVSIEISDTGKGIPAAELGRVFDPFFSTKAVGTGMGLGLAICHNIVTQLGGAIQVQSELGRGTTFTVSLPRGELSDPQPGPTATRERPARSRILFIDDEASLCSAMSRLLQPEHDVVSARQAEDALAMLRSGQRFDVIMCDLMMPGMTGMAFFDAVQDLPGIDPSSVVFMTGGAFGEAAKRFLASVPNACFCKPFELDQLRQWLNTRSSLKAEAP
jgi:CheY-like chemotaxis protein/anti-sigma regulatory factor (Ser/Thr protein kinase)